MDSLVFCKLCKKQIGENGKIIWPCKCVLHYQQFAADRIINPGKEDEMRDFENDT